MLCHLVVVFGTQVGDTVQYELDFDERKSKLQAIRCRTLNKLPNLKFFSLPIKVDEGSIFMFVKLKF